MKSACISLLPALLLCLQLTAQPAPPRPLKPSDLYALPSVGDAQISPDGNWIAYTVSTIDSIKDRRHASIWMVSRDGSQDIQMTSSPEGESRPRWSPDGKYLAFLSGRQDAKGSQVWLMDRRGGEGKKLTDIKGGVNDYAWSPDGKWIAYTRSTSSEDYIMYDQPVLALLPASGGEPRLLSLGLDRPVSNPRWSKDGMSITALITDDRQRYVGSFRIPGGEISRVADGQRSFSTLEAASAGSWLVIMSDPHTPSEIYMLENGKTRKLTSHSDAFLSRVTLATVEGFTSRSADGTAVSGILYRPALSQPGARLPLILFIHGGPVGQDDYGFDFTRQVLASGGYAVAAVNYRGSNGRGLEFCKTISADWGHKEVIDLHGAVDYLVKQGIANPAALGVGGWSYGGILTDYLIASDNRFKAACSGAGTGFTLSLYGVDQYINQYNHEIGAPWKNIQGYLKISYPLLTADKIKTPTLFMSGEKDFNVPTAGSEQMYQALRTLGIPCELIVYPGQFHGLTTPSYLNDRLERYLAWYDKYLK